MCGLYGFTTIKPNKNNFKATAIMGIMNMERGIDSTGIYYKTGDKDSGFLVRDTIQACDFFDKFDFKQVDNISTLIGHNRQATTGDITIENCHPFKIGDVVGTHNGIINNYLKFGKFKVDSQAVFHLLNKSKNDFKSVLPKIDGSMALAWIYKDRLYLTRKENPLYILKTKTTIYYSSLESSLLVLRSMFNITDLPLELSSDKVYIIDKDLNIDDVGVKFKRSSIYENRFDYLDDYDSYRDYHNYKDKTLDDVSGENQSDVLLYAMESLDNDPTCYKCKGTIDDNQFKYDVDSDVCYHRDCLPKTLKNKDYVFDVDLISGIVSGSSI